MGRKAAYKCSPFSIENVGEALEGGVWPEASLRMKGDWIKLGPCRHCFQCPHGDTRAAFQSLHSCLNPFLKYAIVT